MSALKSWSFGAICLTLLLWGAVLEGARDASQRTPGQLVTFPVVIGARSVTNWLRPAPELESNSGLRADERFSEYVFLHHTRNKNLLPGQLCR